MPALNTIEKVLLKIVLLDSGCWTGPGCPRPDGYRSVGMNYKKPLVHCVVYQALRGPIPEGLELDHLCRNRDCCNPDHLEPVTRKVNLNRGDGTGPDFCRKCGGPLTPNGKGRRCSPCKVSYNRERLARQ